MEPYQGKERCNQGSKREGLLIGDFEREFDVRRSDWNVGIGEVELVGEGKGQQVSVPTKRLNENLLSDADCIISLVPKEVLGATILSILSI